MLISASGGVSFLAKRNRDAVAAIRALVRVGAWPPLVPSVVLAESTTGRQRNDAAVNRLLDTCDVREDVPASLARRAGELRHLAQRGSAMDAVVDASAEPGGVVLHPAIAPTAGRVRGPVGRAVFSPSTCQPRRQGSSAWSVYPDHAVSGSRHQASGHMRSPVASPRVRAWRRLAARLYSSAQRQRVAPAGSRVRPAGPCTAPPRRCGARPVLHNARRPGSRGEPSAALHAVLLKSRASWTRFPGSTLRSVDRGSARPCAPPFSRWRSITCMPRQQSHRHARTTGPPWVFPGDWVTRTMASVDASLPPDPAPFAT